MDYGIPIGEIGLEMMFRENQTEPHTANIKIKLSLIDNKKAGNARRKLRPKQRKTVRSILRTFL